MNRSHTKRSALLAALALLASTWSSGAVAAAPEALGHPTLDSGEVVVPGGAVVVPYVGGTASDYPAAVPFVAVAVAPSTATDDVAADDLLKIEVQGHFPSTPGVVVVNEAFEPVATGAGIVQGDGSALATLLVPRDIGARFVLVRDAQWSKPMTFEVRVAE
jgi:hypothetical protein